MTTYQAILLCAIVGVVLLVIVWIVASKSAAGDKRISLRRQESELERELRVTREALAREKQERETERRLFRELRVPEVA